VIIKHASQPQERFNSIHPNRMDIAGLYITKRRLLLMARFMCWADILHKLKLDFFRFQSRILHMKS